MYLWLVMVILLRCQRALNQFESSICNRYQKSIRLKSSVTDNFEYRIETIENRVSLVFTNTLQRENPFCIDFVENAKRFERSPQLEQVCKAVGKCDLVYDLTAGLGRDSLVLAMTGRSVVMLERNEMLFKLLDDGLKRLASHRLKLQLPPLQLKLLHQDSTGDGFSYVDITNNNSTQESSSSLSSSATTRKSAVCVYLDPMYPAGTTGRRAQVKKETQILHRLLGDAQGNDEDNNRQLFHAAKRIVIAGGNSSSRIVVKRPARAAPLLNLVPHSVVEGSTQRFDIYFANRLSEKIQES